MRGTPERASSRPPRAPDGEASRSARALAALLSAMERSAARDPALAALLSSPPGTVQEALSALVLRAALSLSPGSEMPSAAALYAALARGALEARRLGLASRAFAGPSPLSDEGALALFLDGSTLETLLDAVRDPRPDGPPTARALGSIHQELLEVELVRLDAPSVRMETGVWVLARDVLAEPPPVRSKWLQRAAGLPKHAVGRHARALAAARTVEEVLCALEGRGRRTAPGTPPTLVVSSGIGRRRAGSHYTPEALRRAVVERTLAPLVRELDASRLGELAVCDPAMGAGDLLLTVAEYLAERLAAAAGIPRRDALFRVVTECLYGVDKDAIAVDLARVALARLVTDTGGEAPDLSRTLRSGDSLTGRTRGGGGSLFRDGAFPDAIDWPTAFPEVSGFDACVGNPPWVAYAGRAAQPLDPALARHYEAENPAFHGYRTLHGLFVRRAAELLRPGGRLGLVLPTSVADLAGYAPARAAHDALCDVDPELLDFGDGAFEGVFQPCMALTSTRRAGPSAMPPSRAPSEWKLSRTDLDALGTALLARLAALPVLDAALFGERGFQTTGNDLSHLRRLDSPEPPFVVPIREGTDVREFARSLPRLHLDQAALSRRLRPESDYRAVALLIRQTARYPIAALSDGLAFRNSILAGFESAEWDAPALVAYLNSSIVRWYHFTRHRDARQGMPQLKIGHLRALPQVTDARARARLAEQGRRLGERNTGLSAEERLALDDVAFDALGLSGAERTLVRRFAEENRPPRRRGAPS